MAVKRISVSLDERDDDRLQAVKKETRISSESEVMRRALATEAFVQETLDEGGKILVQAKDGSVREVKFVR